MAGEMQRGKASVRGTSTTNILLEGAAWNFINIRKTAKQHNLPSEASFRFSRGVHPALAEQGVDGGAPLIVANTGDRPIQVGSHFHFFEVNRALRFERAKAFGMDVMATLEG